jgi:farnesyl diphosphate synthase
LIPKHPDGGTRWEPVQARIELALDAALPTPAQAPCDLHTAMRYSVLGGGKRLRPLLVHACGQALGARPELLDAPACAVEMIHAYSLIHDDLPAMDDDALRRGKPTCHVAFGEALAILAGDALQALAFEVLARARGVSALQRLDQIRVLARACGSRGMAGGQAIDLAAVGRVLDEPAIRRMHHYKTAALIEAAVLLGAGAAGVRRGPVRQALREYGVKLGLAFQIQDDILDIEGDASIMGKSVGSDHRQAKPTYPATVGIQNARDLAHRLAHEAVAALDVVPGDAEPLVALAQFTIERVW